MKEPSPWFFMLLNYAYRLDAEEKIQQISIVSAPHMEKPALDQLVDGLKMQSRDIIEMLAPHDDYSGISKLKKEMGKKQDG